LGGDIFAIPTFNGLNYLSNNDLTSRATGRVIAGQSHDLTDSDYRVTVMSDPTGADPSVFDIQVEALDADGRQTLDQNNVPIVATYKVSGKSGTFNEILGGVELEFASGSNYAQGDTFLFQPTRKAAAEVSMATTRPEDLAFASPMRVDIDINNLGDATVQTSGTTNTNTANNAYLSAFNRDSSLDAAGGSPHATLGAPTQVLFTASDAFQVLDSSNNVITTVTGVTQYDNLLAQAADSVDWPTEFSRLADYPGYDFSLQGEIRTNDKFTLSFNTNGISDNTNAVAMADLQKAGNIKISNNNTGSLATFHEAYSNLVGKVGGSSGRAEVTLEAAMVMKNQAQDWFDSVSGVSLDEEAANLIRYQQSYAAAARIITTAREMFDTILAAAR
jgi:flagellar hook-associated protein 1 FlgK